MPNPNRNRGDYFERKVRDALIVKKWFVVRSAGSYGPADLVALKDGCVPLLVSCKLTGVLRRAERNQLWQAAIQAGARPVVASRPGRGLIDWSILSNPTDTARLPVIDL